MRPTVPRRPPRARCKRVAETDGEEVASPDSAQPTGVVDVVESLKASVEATKAKQGGLSGLWSQESGV